jgi:uncharacterized membrane protein YdbT with pleckstrin-like domain
MPFPKKLLTSDEHIVVESRPHWKTLVRPVLTAIVLVAAAVAIILYTDLPHLIVAGAGALLAVLAVVPAYVRWRFTLFVLTNERLIRRTGVLAKHSKEIPLEVINDVSFSQSILDRILGAGNLMLESAGEHGQELFGNVRKPEALQKRIYEASEGRKGHGPSLTVADELAKLADLRDRGVLTDAEFEDRKRKLLG